MFLNITYKVTLNYAIANYGAVSQKVTLANKKDLKKLRHGYIHISTNPKALGMGANKPSFWSIEVARKIIPDNTN